MNSLQGEGLISAILCVYITYKYIQLSFLAERVTNNLKELAQQVTPGDIVSTYGIRKAMGISVPLPDTEDSWVDLTEGELQKCLVPSVQLTQNPSCESLHWLVLELAVPQFQLSVLLLFLKSCF